MSARTAQTDLDWLLRYIESRFGADSDLRLITALGRDTVAPRFVFARSRHGNLWRFGAELPVSVVRNLARLAGREPAISDPEAGLAPPDRIEPMRATLERADLADTVERRALLRGHVPADSTWRWDAIEVHHHADGEALAAVSDDAAPGALHSLGWNRKDVGAAIVSGDSTLVGDLHLFH